MTTVLLYKKFVTPFSNDCSIIKICSHFRCVHWHRTSGFTAFVSLLWGLSSPFSAPFQETLPPYFSQWIFLSAFQNAFSAFTPIFRNPAKKKCTLRRRRKIFWGILEKTLNVMAPNEISSPVPKKLPFFFLSNNPKFFSGAYRDCNECNIMKHN